MKKVTWKRNVALERRFKRYIFLIVATKKNFFLLRSVLIHNMALATAITPKTYNKYRKRGSFFSGHPRTRKERLYYLLRRYHN